MWTSPGFSDTCDLPLVPWWIWLAGEIAAVHRASSGTYGALRVTAELRYGRNIIVGHNAVESIMRELGIKGLPTRRRPKGARLAQVVSLIWFVGRSAAIARTSFG